MFYRRTDPSTAQDIEQQVDAILSDATKLPSTNFDRSAPISLASEQALRDCKITLRVLKLDRVVRPTSPTFSQAVANSVERFQECVLEERVRKQDELSKQALEPQSLERIASILVPRLFISELFVTFFVKQVTTELLTFYTKNPQIQLPKPIIKTLKPKFFAKDPGAHLDPACWGELAGNTKVSGNNTFLLIGLLAI